MVRMYQIPDKKIMQRIRSDVGGVNMLSLFGFQPMTLKFVRVNADALTLALFWLRPKYVDLTIQHRGPISTFAWLPGLGTEIKRTINSIAEDTGDPLDDDDFIDTPASHSSGRHHYSTATIESIERMVKQGTKIRAICERLNCSEAVVKRVRERLRDAGVI